MFIRLTQSEIAHRLFTDPYAGWSYEGAQTLAGELLELERLHDQETSFDLAEIRANWTEYVDAVSALIDLGYDEHIEDQAHAWRLLGERYEFVFVDGTDGRPTTRVLVCLAPTE